MAVYTVEVKTICEQQYLTNQGSADPKILVGVNYNDIIANTYGNVLPEDFPIWNTGSTSDIKKAILRHYWLREIGMETVGQWKYYLQTRLQEIMPWYVDLHGRLDDAANVFLNQLDDSTDTFTHGHTIQKSGTDTRTVDNTVNDTGSRDIDTTDTGTVDNNGTNDTHAEELYSDTPQNGLENVIQGKYLTSAQVNSNTNSVDNTETRNLEVSSKELRDLQIKTSGTDALQYGMKDTHGGDDIRKIIRNGFSGDKVDVLERYQRLHLNIIQEIIKNVADCFMGVYG